MYDQKDFLADIIQIGLADAEVTEHAPHEARVVIEHLLERNSRRDDRLRLYDMRTHDEGRVHASTWRLSMNFMYQKWVMSEKVAVP